MFLTLTTLVFLTVFARGCLFGARSGEYIVDLFANNLETSFITNDEEILTMVWEVDNTVPDLRIDCGVSGVTSQTSQISQTSQCNAAFPYIVSANTSDVAANQVVVDVTIRNARDADALPSMVATHRMEYLDGTPVVQNIDMTDVCARASGTGTFAMPTGPTGPAGANASAAASEISFHRACVPICWFEDRQGYTTTTENATRNGSAWVCPHAAFAWNVGWRMKFPQVPLPGETDYRDYAAALQVSGDA
jgi:hypothetical protein